MGPYGPGVKEINKFQLECLKAKYGDKPYDELRRLAMEESSRQIRKIEQERQQHRTA